MAVLRATVSAAVGVGGLAVAFGGWLRAPATRAERAVAGVAGLLLVYPSGLADAAGFVLLGVVIAAHLLRLRAAHSRDPDSAARA
jgi:TRAP-type uncharacterized transport system fused permease subunit